MKKVISLITLFAIVLASFSCFITANAETITNVFITKNQTVKCKMGSYYTGDFKFLTNSTPPEEGNPFADQYMAEEANGKWLVVEVTLEEVNALVGTCPDPSEVTLAVAAQSETTEWGNSCNGYPNFNGIGDTIKLSTMQLPEDYSVTTDEYWQFVIQLGLTDESPAKINAIKGESKFEAVVSVKSYISDTPCYTPVHLSDTLTSTEGQAAYIKKLAKKSGDCAPFFHEDGTFNYKPIANLGDNMLVICASQENQFPMVKEAFIGSYYYTTPNYNDEIFITVNNGIYRILDAFYNGLITNEHLEAIAKTNGSPFYALGDVNSDKKINITDVVMIRSAIVKNTSRDLISKGDISLDHRISIVDVVIMRSKIVNG